MTFDFETFDLEKFLYGNPTFEDTANLMDNLLTELYACNEEIGYLTDNEMDTESADEKRADVEDMLSQVAHLVLNNAMYLLSNGAEYEFIYTLTDKDKENYRFLFKPLKELTKIIYGGCQGTIDLEFENGTEIDDFSLDCQEMEMIAHFMYDKTKE